MIEIIIDKEEEKKTIGVIENGKLIEVYEENKENKHERNEGNIYVGIVKDIIPGMQAAFIDIGTEKNSFIHVRDIMPQIDEKIERKEEKKIKDLVKPKQKLLVQVQKDSNDKKGARTTTHIKLTGKYVILLPQTTIVTVSQKIQDETEKNRLIKLVKENLQENMGAIIRTVAEKKENEIKQKVVVACKDFTSEKQKLVEFSSLANSITDVDKKFTTKIEDIYEVFNNLNYDFDKKLMIENFWNMFVVDTLIGNTDRHLSNFGVIDDGKTLKFAPVYDCGSALHPLLTDEKINYLLNNESEFKNVTYSIYPVYTYENKKITYSEFYKKDISDLNDALLRICPRIEMNKIYDIIDNTMYLSLERKEFLKKSVTIRKEKILDVAYKKLNK